MANDKPSETLLVALLICLVCSLAVSVAAVSMRGLQQKNKLLDRQKNVIAVSGLTDEEDLSQELITDLFKQIQAHAIDLDTGEKISDFDINAYDQRKASKASETSIVLNKSDDVASIGRRENVSIIYEVYKREELDAVILPIRGYGLWSTLYGYLALEEDGKTVRGITFYEHSETPGLGGEVDNPQWKAGWQGKTTFSDSGEVLLRVVKGLSRSQTEIDGISGATITSRGVDNMLQFWLSDKGYKKYISENLQKF